MDKNEKTEAVNVCEALRLCVEHLDSLVKWRYLWARARTNEAGDSIGAIDKALAEIQQLVKIFGQDSPEAVELTFAGRSLETVEQIMAGVSQTYLHEGDMYINEQCDHGGGPYTVRLGERRVVYLCELCYGLANWETIKRLVKVAVENTGQVWGYATLAEIGRGR